MVVGDFEFNALAHLINELEKGWLPLEPVDQTVFWGWDPWPIRSFLPEMVRLSTLDHGGKFLEVGCGIGSKLLLARMYGFEVAGVELRPEFVAACRRLVPDAPVFEADAGEWFGYGEFDIVYVYVPMLIARQDWANPTPIEIRILEQMRPGALLLLAERDTPKLFGFQHLGGHLWRKPTG